jgi:hypothetical protein
MFQKPPALIACLVSLIDRKSTHLTSRHQKGLVVLSKRTSPFDPFLLTLIKKLKYLSASAIISQQNHPECRGEGWLKTAVRKDKLRDPRLAV